MGMSTEFRMSHLTGSPLAPTLAAVHGTLPRSESRDHDPAKRLVHRASVRAEVVSVLVPYVSSYFYKSERGSVSNGAKPLPQYPVNN